MGYEVQACKQESTMKHPWEVYSEAWTNDKGVAIWKENLMYDKKFTFHEGSNDMKN